tara:strand:- start:3569 stop:3832 length:264 start_codon:yes stop_codon:yes gene_type:complete
MKNILIITNTRDNLGSSLSFVKDITDITDSVLREMIRNCINGTNWNRSDKWVSDGMCGSDGGYIFNDYPLLDTNLPIKVEHIVNYVF